ncbi:MAG TPA: DUF1501 domain-containing protein [Planctomycetota bacterium]
MADARLDPPDGCSRRALLRRVTNGYGMLALGGLVGTGAFANAGRLIQDPAARTLGLPGLPHHRPRARNVIFLYMDGGPSQVDTFDPKPRLDREHGQPIGMKIPKTQFDDVGGVFRSPWKFEQHGECGLPVSELFPGIAKHADKLAVIRSMVAEFPEHTSANYFLHTGFGVQGRPSIGSWISYGLGSEAADLPGFVVLNGGLIPPGGLDCFQSGFLPASFQGSVFTSGPVPVANLAPAGGDSARQRRQLDLLAGLERSRTGALAGDAEVDAAIGNYELAFRMQSAVPDLADLGQESAATRKLYGLDAEAAGTRTYARLCLLARRLVERGVRFVELTCPAVGHDRWDQHGNLKKGHEDNARAVDQPIAALLTDLAARGLLDETLVVWGGEFGRTPMAQGSDGRDHNPHGYTMWLAGGGARPGIVHGATDDYGYFAVQDKVTMHDLHATILHLMGVDHRRLTFRFSGRDMRLTDVHGEVVRELLA